MNISNAIEAAICIVAGCAIGAAILLVLTLLGERRLDRLHREYEQGQRLEAARSLEGRMATAERKLHVLEGDGR